MTNSCKSDHLITHQLAQKDNLFKIDEHEKRLKEIKDPVLPLEEELLMLKQLNEFELGRFLLNNKGLNGYWTSYVISAGVNKQSLQPLERWVLFSSPVVKATRERFYIFKKILQDNIKDNYVMASIPCGVMDDLLSLDVSNHKNTKFVGVDYDKESIRLAKERSKSKNVQARFSQQNAWDLNEKQQFDVITSNGLNIYEPNDEKVILLYQNFFDSLKSGGVLVTSFLTPPPNISQDSTWKNFKQEDLIKQKALFVDIIGVGWQVFRTESQTISQLNKAGFKNIEIIYDTQGMFPTVIAKK